MNLFETINHWAESWISFMGYRMLDSAFVFAVVGFIWLLVRKWISVHFGYFLFLLVLIKLVLPTPIYLPTLFLNFQPRTTVLQTSEDINFLGDTRPEAETKTMRQERVKDSPKEPITSAATLSVDSQILSHFGYLMLGWAIISLFFFLRLGWAMWKTRFMMQNTIPLDPRSIPLDLELLKNRAGVKRRVRWVTGDWVKSPMAYGTIHPVIAIPKDMKENFTTNQIRWILLHELAHIRRGDSWISTFQKILLAIFFFNPLVWWASSIVDRLREYACDDAALVGSQTSPKECGEGFLGVVMLMNNLPTFSLATLGMFDYETMIKKRLMRILVKRKFLQSKLSFGVSVWLMVITLFVLPVEMKFAFAHVAQWTLLPTDKLNIPTERCCQSMAYDSHRGVSILNGGLYWDLLLSDTWEWDGRTWKQVSAAGPMRHCAGMDFDPIRNVTVLYGGYNGANFTFDRSTYSAVTWEYNGKAWKPANLEDTELRAGAPLVYFPELKCVIRHGGIDGNPSFPFTTYFNDTCMWDGTHWSKIAEGPTRAFHKLVYDSVRKKAVLFGGFDAPASYPEDTWEFDGYQWVQVAVSGPPGRHWFGFAFDEIRRVAVLFGGNRWFGYSPKDIWLGDTWEWNGKKWREINTPNPGTAYSPEMVYDSQQQKIVMFLPGGRGAGTTAVDRNTHNLKILRETWEYGVAPNGVPLASWKWR